MFRHDSPKIMQKHDVPQVFRIFDGTHVLSQQKTGIFGFAYRNDTYHVRTQVLLPSDAFAHVRISL